jgi:hypothetical protein
MSFRVTAQTWKWQHNSEISGDPMEKFAAFFKNLGAFWTVIAAFPPGAQAFYSLAALVFLVIFSMFIRQYSITSTLLKTSSETAMLEKKSLGGDPTAILELSLSDSPRALEVLSTVLGSNPRDDIRKVAAQALANLKDPERITSLGVCLEREKWEVAAACAEALGRSRDPRAIPYLIHALELNVDWLVAQKSAEALGFFPASPRVTAALITALDIGSFPGKAAKQSLVGEGAGAVAQLTEYVLGDHPVEGIQLGVEALGSIGEPSAADALKRLRDRVSNGSDAQNRKDQLITVINQAIRRCGGTI